MIAEARREQIREMLMEAGAVTVSQLQARFGVSPMTARRDLVALEERGSARRTHGGAVLPSIAAPENSFSQRSARRPRPSCGSPTRRSRCCARGDDLPRLLLDGLLPRPPDRRDRARGARVDQQRAGDAGAGRLRARHRALVIGGTHRRLTGSFVGPSAVRMIREHFVDRLFFSVTGIAPNGMLTDADDLEAAVKRAMLDQAARGHAAARRVQARHARPPRDRADGASRWCSPSSTTRACTRTA